MRLPGRTAASIPGAGSGDPGDHAAVAGDGEGPVAERREADDPGSDALDAKHLAQCVDGAVGTDHADVAVGCRKRDRSLSIHERTDVRRRGGVNGSVRPGV